MNCKYCGTELDETFNACPSCGAAIVEKRKSENLQENHPPQYHYIRPLPQRSHGRNRGNQSLIFGIISVFFGSTGLYATSIFRLFGIVFGFLAISIASKDKKIGKNYTAGFILGIIGLSLGILRLIFWR